MTTVPAIEVSSPSWMEFPYDRQPPPRPAPDPRATNPRVPELLARITLRCLQKQPDARYPSTREILGELKAGRTR